MPTTSTPIHRDDCASRPVAGVQPIIVFTGRQIRQLATLAAHDDTEIAVGFARGTEAAPAGLHAWNADAQTAPIRLEEAELAHEEPK